MTVKRSERVIPLKLKASNMYAINAGITSAFDYARDDGVSHVGTAVFTKDNDAVFPIVAVDSDISGRDPSQGKTGSLAYRKIYPGSLGFATVDGKGPFTLHHRYRTPSGITLTATANRTLCKYTHSSGGIITLSMTENTNGYFYFYWDLGGASLPTTAVRSTVYYRFPPNTIVDIYLVRNGDNLYAYFNDAPVVSASAPALSVTNYNWTGMANGSQHGFTGSTPTDIILIDQTTWNRALSDAEIMQHKADPYAGYENTAIVPPGITIVNPINNETINTEGFIIRGFYTGEQPTSIQARYNNGSWFTLVANPSGGNFEGMHPPVATGAGLLELRYGNNINVISAVRVTAKPPAPEVNVISQSNPDGQDITFVVSYRRATSLTIELNAEGNGAVSRTINLQVPYSTNTNQATQLFEGIEGGDYSVSISVSGASETTTIAGTAFSILGVENGGNYNGDVDTTPIPEVVVTITPSTIVTDGSPIQFNATVNGKVEPVSWSTNIGSINSSGLFTPPVQTNLVQTGSVTVMSVNYPGKLATASITVPAKNPDVPIEAPNDNYYGNENVVLYIGGTSISTDFSIKKD